MKSGIGYLLLRFSVPKVLANIPVINVDREGEHAGAENTFSNNTPCSANLSIFGVVANLFP